MTDNALDEIPEVVLRVSFIWKCPNEKCGTTFSVPEEEILIQKGECMICGQLVTFKGFKPRVKLFSRDKDPSSIE